MTNESAHSPLWYVRFGVAIGVLMVAILIWLLGQGIDKVSQAAIWVAERLHPGDA